MRKVSFFCLSAVGLMVFFVGCPPPEPNPLPCFENGSQLRVSSGDMLEESTVPMNDLGKVVVQPVEGMGLWVEPAAVREDGEAAEVVWKKATVEYQMGDPDWGGKKTVAHIFDSVQGRNDDSIISGPVFGEVLAGVFMLAFINEILTPDICVYYPYWTPASVAWWGYSPVLAIAPGPYYGHWPYVKAAVPAGGKWLGLFDRTNDEEVKDADRIVVTAEFTAALDGCQQDIVVSFMVLLDNDGDGVPNWRERECGSDPDDPESDCEPQPPECNLSVGFSQPVNGADVCEGDSIFFEATHSGGVEPLTFKWVFSDGEIRTGDCFNRVFESVGKNTFTLTAKDANGCESEPVCGVINVVDCTPPVPSLEASFEGIPDEVCLGETQQFTLDISGGVPPYTVEWESDNTFASGQTFWFTYNTVGSSYVRATITDAGKTKITLPQKTFSVIDCGGCEGESEGEGEGEGEELSVSILKPADGAHLAINQEYEFSGSIVGGEKPYGLIEWFFPDGVILYGETVHHSFSFGGEGDIYFIVVDAAGARVQKSIHIVVDE